MSIVILKATLSYLRFNCIWPKKGQELNPEKSYYIRFALLFACTPVLLIGSTSHLVVSLQHNSYNIIEDLVVIIAEIGVYYFIGVFVFYEKKIAKIYLDLSDFEKFEKPYNFDERNKRLIFLSRAYKSFIDLAVFNVSWWPFVAKKSCEEGNQHRDFQEICGLLFTTWMPFNVEVFPVKPILYVWQICVVILTMKGAAIISFAIMESMEHLVLRIQHLKVLLMEAINTQDDKLRYERFATCVKYHIDIFDIGQRIDECYTGCLFLHVLLSGALFGCIGYRSMEVFSINAVSILIAWILSLYIVCISGQHLIDEAMSVADTAYNSNWYERDRNFQKDIALIIVRSQEPIVVHAGPFSYLSHVIMLTIFKTAYSYLTLLNATSK